jgi:hypothetical protein
MNTRFDLKLAERSQLFNQFAGRDVPTKRIDCDVDETGPGHLWMTRNVIREILEIATVRPPVVYRITGYRKTLDLTTAKTLSIELFLDVAGAGTSQGNTHARQTIAKKFNFDGS